MIQVYHEENGLIFRKHEADTGISYIAVPIEELEPEEPLKGLLVRHGNPHTGQCGYYPLSLLLTTPDKRYEIASKQHKRPPNENWVQRILSDLKCEGLKLVH
jgi:hypothetical protein